MHSQLLPTIALPPPPVIQGEDSAQGINLDLGIGRCGYGDVNKDEKIEQARKEQQSLFSAWQFHEFFNQIIVYNWIICGSPVPVTLFSPSCFSVQNCDQSVKMDPEPGRCRRTDGRKWRCSRSVVPGQKYCERHVHRGRQGSRKHVEPAKRGAILDNNKIPNVNKTPVILPVNYGVDSRVDLSDKGDCNLEQHCGSNNNESNKSHDAIVLTDAPVLGLEVNKNNNGDHATSSTCANGKKSGLGNVNPTKISRRKQYVTKNNYHGFVSPGFGLSPKSVLHCDAGKVGLGLDSKVVAETEQQRCWRTDGKKWRCRRDVVPGQKYCEAHMHRGAKRIMLNPESASNVPTTPTRSTYDSGTIAGHPDDRINLNTVPASPQHTTGNNSTTSSDATTISDENISYCLNQSLHKG